MVLGQSAATAACQAIDDKTSVQDVSYPRLRDRLLQDRQVLDWTGPTGPRPVAGIDPKKLEGVVLDDDDAERQGFATTSRAAGPFVGAGYRHDSAERRGSQSARYTPDLPASGRYEVRLSYSPNPNRATNVPVTIRHADGETVVKVNQRLAPPLDSAVRRARDVPVREGQGGSVTIGNAARTVTSSSTPRSGGRSRRGRARALIRIGHCQARLDQRQLRREPRQVHPRPGAADRDRVAIVSFPECFLTGYQDSGEAARKSSFAVDSPEMLRVLDATSRHDATAIVGFNERPGRRPVQHRGRGPARAFAGHLQQVFRLHAVLQTRPHVPDLRTRGGQVRRGHLRRRRLRRAEPHPGLQGPRIIFSPHYNYIGKDGLIEHFMHVRADHVARTVENDVHFVRGNNVVLGKELGLTRYEGVGYGDSYIVDPRGEILVRSRRHQEDFFFADIDPSVTDRNWGLGRSLYSFRELGPLLAETARRALGTGDGDQGVEGNRGQPVKKQ